MTMTTSPTVAAPERPPRSWFSKPAWLEPGQRLTILDTGQVAGYFYEAGACLVDGSTRCWSPPASPTGYRTFHQGEVVCADGSHIRVGVVGNVGGHPDVAASATSAHRHYSDPDGQLLVVRAGDDRHGGWVAGSLIPGVTEAGLRLLRRSSLSGDWRPWPWQHFASAGASRRAAEHADYYDCLSVTLVTTPGAPLVKAYAKTASARPVFVGEPEDPVTGPTATAQGRMRDAELDLAQRVIVHEREEHNRRAKQVVHTVASVLAGLEIDTRQARMAAAGISDVDLEPARGELHDAWVAVKGLEAEARDAFMSAALAELDARVLTPPL